MPVGVGKRQRIFLNRARHRSRVVLDRNVVFNGNIERAVEHNAVAVGVAMNADARLIVSVA